MGNYGVNAEELMPKLDEFLKDLEGDTSAEEIAKAFNMLAEKYEFPDKLLFVWTIENMAEFNCIDKQIDDIGGLPTPLPKEDDISDDIASCCRRNVEKAIYLDPFLGGKKHTKNCIQREILWLYGHIDDLSRTHPSGLSYKERIKQLYDLIKDGVYDYYNQQIAVFRVLSEGEDIYKIYANGDKFIIESTKENINKLSAMIRSEKITEAIMWNELGKKVD